MVSRRLRALVRDQWAGLLALFLVLTGGTAWAANTVFSEDIVDGEVHTSDLGTESVTSAKVAEFSLQGTDIADNAIGSQQVAGLTGLDIINDSIFSEDVDDLTGLDIEDETLSGLDIESITGADVAFNSLGPADIAGLGPGEIVDNSLGSSEVTSLGPGDILDNTLGSSEISGLGGGDIADGSLGSEDIRQEGLRGEDIDEGTLDLGCQIPYVRGIALIKAKSGLPSRNFTSAPRWVEPIYTCSGGPVEVIREVNGRYVIRFNGVGDISAGIGQATAPDGLSRAARSDWSNFANVQLADHYGPSALRVQVLDQDEFGEIGYVWVFAY